MKKLISFSLFAGLLILAMLASNLAEAQAVVPVIAQSVSPGPPIPVIAYRLNLHRHFVYRPYRIIRPARVRRYRW